MTANNPKGSTSFTIKAHFLKPLQHLHRREKMMLDVYSRLLVKRAIQTADTAKTSDQHEQVANSS